MRPRGTNFRSQAAQYLVAQHIFNTTHVSHIYDDNGKKETLTSLLSGDNKELWTQALSNEWGRVANGNIFGIKGTETLEFIAKHLVPSNKTVTYGSFVCDHRPLKTEKWRVRLVVGGDKLPYESDSGSPAANLLDTKILLNSVISQAKDGARFLSCDLKDFFLASPMESPEYMKIPYKYFPADIRKRYNLDAILHADGYIYCKINKGMYGLKQAAILAYNKLSNHLKEAGYKQITGSNGMWKHTTNNITFCLCVDDFGVKYHTKEDATNFLAMLGKHYNYTVDWTGRNFCGLTMDWHYNNGYVDISMPDYIKDSLRKLQHIRQTNPQYSPHKYIAIQYGKSNTQQYATSEDTSPLLSPQGTKYIQSGVGALLYYARAIDASILPALNSIGTQQAQPTEKTKENLQHLLDYVATYPNVILRYYASDMILKVDSDAAYLVLPKARSRIAGYFRLENRTQQLRKDRPNGPILIECKTLRRVVTSAAEAETSGVFTNAQTSIPIRYILTQMGHPQPPTPLKTDNTTTRAYTYNNIMGKKSKAWDMNLNWLRDKETHKEFNIFWEKGNSDKTFNESDYYTKHHPTIYHRQIRDRYTIDKTRQSVNLLNSISITLRGCINPTQNHTTNH